MFFNNFHNFPRNQRLNDCFFTFSRTYYFLSVADVEVIAYAQYDTFEFRLLKSSNEN